MPKAAYLVGWDNRIGPIIEANFPLDILIENERILHYLMSLQTLKTSQILQVKDEKESVLIYGVSASDRARDVNFDYSFIVLLIDEGEEENLGQFKMLLAREGKKILKATHQEKKDNFIQFARSLFKPPNYKIIFLGFPNAGKTSTKKFLFEKMQEEQILSTTIEPTQGFENTYYKIMDINLALFDMAGQELDRWLEEDESILEGSDLIVFFFSVEDWKENPEKVRNYLSNLSFQKEKRDIPGVKLIVFCHKSDLLTAKDLEIKKAVLKLLQPFKIPVFFTTLENGGNDELFAGMQLILTCFSKLIIDFNNLIIPLLQQFKLDPLFIMDAGARVVTNLVQEKKFPEIERMKIKTVLVSLIQKYTQVFSENLPFSTIWLENAQIFIVCINFSCIHKELAYLVCKTTSLENFHQLFDSYNKIVLSFNWETKKG